MVDPVPAAPINPLRARWAAGEPTFGAIVTMPSPQVIQVLAGAGLDWVIIDMEHGPIDLGTAHTMILATGGTPTIPFVRIAATVPWLAKPLLDCGALGIAFPRTNTPDDAARAVHAVRYPPVGGREWGPFFAPLRWGQTPEAYMATANANVMALITIEHPDAVADIDAICGTPGIDLACIGPGDLSMSMGHPGNPGHPAVLAAMAEAERGIVASGVPIAGVARTPEAARQMIDRGYQGLLLGFDWSIMTGAVRGYLEALR